MNKQFEKLPDDKLTTIDNTSKGTCVHAILVEKDLGMRDIWLPAKIEGKYNFSGAGDNISIVIFPILILSPLFYLYFINVTRV